MGIQFGEFKHTHTHTHTHTPLSLLQYSAGQSQVGAEPSLPPQGPGLGILAGVVLKQTEIEQLQPSESSWEAKTQEDLLQP